MTQAQNLILFAFWPQGCAYPSDPLTQLAITCQVVPNFVPPRHCALSPALLETFKYIHSLYYFINNSSQSQYAHMILIFRSLCGLAAEGHRTASVTTCKLVAVIKDSCKSWQIIMNSTQTLPFTLKFFMVDQ